MTIPLYWDCFGSMSVNSGISHYAWRLWTEFKMFDWYPRLMVDERYERIENDLGHESLGPLRFSKLGTQKLVWPQLVGRHLMGRHPSSGQGIFHGLNNFNLPLSMTFHRHYKTVLTIHDLIPLIDSVGVSRSLSLQLKWYLPKILPVVDRIICVSDWTLATLLSKFPIVQGKALRIYSGVVNMKTVVENKNCKESRIKILYISRFEKYKNFGLFKEILTKARDEIVGDVITDSLGEQYLLQDKTLVQSGRLRIHRNISESAKENLLREADVYVHTSKYEGFCLPASEALSYALPVVYLSGSGIDEVVGQCGFKNSLVDSVSTWIDTIKEAARVRSRKECYKICQNHLKAIGSWEKTARKVKQQYESLIE